MTRWSQLKVNIAPSFRAETGLVVEADAGAKSAICFTCFTVMLSSTFILVKWTDMRPQFQCHQNRSGDPDIDTDQYSREGAMLS